MEMYKIPLDTQERIKEIVDQCRLIKPKLIIYTLTFNHAKYIADALDSFLNQKTDFPFVVIVHDDASTDETVEILKSYAAKFPNKILPIFEKQNQYSDPEGNVGWIMNQTIKNTGAKYIAFCEGDDYWTYPEKLQKQVDFLESHPDYSMCFHSSAVLNEDVDSVPQSCEKIENRDYSADEILSTWIIPTNSVVMRAEALIERPWHKDFFVGDNVTWASCISHGKIHGFNHKWSVYRRHASGWTHQNLQNKKIIINSIRKWVKHYEALKECFPNINPSIFDKMILTYRSSLVIQSFISDRKNFLSIFSTSYHKYGFIFFRYLFNTGFDSIKRHFSIK